MKDLFLNPHQFFAALWSSRLFHFVPDRIFLQIKYFLIFGKRLNLESPETFNEKIQWLKLYDRKPEYTQMVDKYEARKYIENKIGKEYLIPLFGVWDNFDDINFDSLPDSFVLKANHFSGGVFICKNKQNFDIKKVRQEINRVLKRNYYFYGREWPYKNVKPKIIAEKYLDDKKHIVPKDFKIYCFNGLPKLIVIFHDRYNNTTQKSESVYDTEWNLYPCSLDEHFLINTEKEPKPECLDELLYLTRKMCCDFSQVRIDWYIIDNKIYAGEITLHTASGFTRLIPNEYDKLLGSWISLPPRGAEE